MSLPQFMVLNSSKKHSELLNDFKYHLNQIITTLHEDYTDSFDNLLQNCKVFTKSLYDKLMKIKFYLLLLEIKDQNQTNKYEYERCINSISFINFNNITHLIQKMHGFIDNDLEVCNEKILNITKMLNYEQDRVKNTLVTQYENNFNQLTLNDHDQIIMQYNNFINNILLEVICVNEIVKKITISSQSW